VRSPSKLPEISQYLQRTKFLNYNKIKHTLHFQSDRLTQFDSPLQGAPDWLIEIRSPDQNTLELQNKILHCLINGTQLAWLIDIQRKQIGFGNTQNCH